MELLKKAQTMKNKVDGTPKHVDTYFELERESSSSEGRQDGGG